MTVIQGGKIRRFLPTTVTFTAIGITAIDIFVKKHSDSTWLQVGKSLDTSTGLAEFRLLPSDFVVGDIIDLKLKDVDTDISAIAESLEILPSFTLDVYPTGAKALESAQTFSGTGLTGKQLTITLSSTTGEKVVTTTPVAEEWSEDIALTTGDGFDSGDNVNVEIARTTYDSKDYGELYSVVGTLVIETGYAPFITGNIELDSAFNVSVASTLEGKNIIVEAQLSGGDWSSVTQIGTAMVTEGIALVSCTVPEADFDANDVIQVRARYGTLASVAENLSVIATITMVTPVLTAGVEGNITGTSNGAEVDVYYRVSSPEGSWEVFEEGVAVSDGNWSATGTIASADTYDFIAQDSNDPDGFARADDVVVASGYIEGKVILVANRESTYFAQLSQDSGANFTDIGGAIEDNTRCVALSSTGKYGLLGGSRGYLIKIVDGVASNAVEVSDHWRQCTMSDSGQYQLAISDAGYAFSNDYGTTWNQFQTSKDFACCCLNPTGQYIAIFQTSGKAYFSNDYGANWTERSMSGYSDKCCITNDGSRIYYGVNSSGSGVYRCTSNGGTQTSISTRGCSNIACYNGGLVILQRYGNYTDVSTNYGTSWSTISAGVTAFYDGSGKLSPDGSIFFCCSSTGYICTLQSPWTTYSQKSYRPYHYMIDCTYDGKYVVTSTNEHTTGGIGYSSDYGENFSTKLSTSRIWSKIAISTKRTL